MPPWWLFRFSPLVFLLALLITLAAPLLAFDPSPPFSPQPEFGDVATTVTLSNGLPMLVHAPTVGLNAMHRPRLVFYALPNGNSTAQTFGRRVPQPERWRYMIQHIGAQTRRLWELEADKAFGEHLVVAYLEAPKKSWPSWRTNTPDAPQAARALIDDATAKAVCPTCDVRKEFVAHSGGGALLFALVDADDAIASDIVRLAWIDANYAYSREKQHDRKLADWLASTPEAELRVMAYDDREITIDGKKIISDTGGTWRRTHEMIVDLGARFPLTQSTHGDIDAWRGLDGRIELLIHRNPGNKILHTVLVERNGFLYCVSTKSVADRARWLYTDRDYDAWVGERPLRE